MKNLSPSRPHLRLGKRVLRSLSIGKKVIRKYIGHPKTKKLVQFSFNILHRIIPTRKELKKYKLVTDDICSLPPNQDSLKHTFWHCNESINLYTKTLRWFNDYYKTKIPLLHQQIVLNSFEDSFLSELPKLHKSRLRLLILLQKKYLYTCKKLFMKPFLDEFLAKLNEQCRVERVSWWGSSATGTFHFYVCKKCKPYFVVTTVYNFK